MHPRFTLPIDVIVIGANDNWWTIFWGDALSRCVVASAAICGCGGTVPVPQPSSVTTSELRTTGVGAGSQMVTESRSRDQLTCDEHPVPRLSSTIVPESQTSDAEAGSQMVTESRSRDRSTSDECPVPQLSSVTTLRLQTSGVGAGSQMVTESRSRDQSTSDERPVPQPSLVTISELRISEAGANPQMVTEFRSRDQSTFGGQPVSQLSSTTMPNSHSNLSMLQDELLPSSSSDTSRPRAPLEETLRPRTLVRSFEMPFSAHVVNAEVVPQLPGPSSSSATAGALLDADPVILPQYGSTITGGPSGVNPVGGRPTAPVPVVRQPGYQPIPAGGGEGFTSRRTRRSESEDDMHSVRSHGSARSRRSDYRTETDRDYSTERDEPAPRPTPHLRRRLCGPDPIFKETEFQRERERELVAIAPTPMERVGRGSAEFGDLRSESEEDMHSVRNHRSANGRRSR
jgi:hypothetical protein